MTEKFEVLDDRQHALLRSGVYIGSVVEEQQSGIVGYEYQTLPIVPGLIKIIEEVIQNSIDEAIRTNFKFANKISVEINDTIDGTEIVVEDNGRGIPQDMIDGKLRPVHAWTSLRAGSNFDDNKRVGVGLNGMGVSLTNIFSTEFVGMTHDGKNCVVVRCTDNMANIDPVKQFKSSHKGTKVSFYPDLKRFGTIEPLTQPHVYMIHDRLTNWAIQFPEITFTFNGKAIKFKSYKDIGSKFHDDAVVFEGNGCGFVFAPSGNEEEFRCLSYVNGIYIKNGGSHVDYILDRIIVDIRAAVKKKHKIDVLPNQIKQHILFASWIRGFPALRFDSQSKERVTNTVAENSAFLGWVDTDKIAKKIIDTPAIIDPMIAAILYKKELQEARELEKKRKAGKQKLVVNHIAATDPNPENRACVLTEGLSAISALVNVRNPKTIGGYPLKGKVTNITGMRPLEIMKNAELHELMTIIGLHIGEKAENLNYGKIFIFSDFDQDGHHIYSLLINFFALWPELFEQKRIYRLLSPLYYCTKGKQTKTFQTIEEFNQFDSKGWDVQYFKGQGSMPEEVYAEVVNNPMLECVVLDDVKKLTMAFGDDANARKEWMTK